VKAIIALKATKKELEKNPILAIAGLILSKDLAIEMVLVEGQAEDLVKDLAMGQAKGPAEGSGED